LKKVSYIQEKPAAGEGGDSPAEEAHVGVDDTRRKILFKTAKKKAGKEKVENAFATTFQYQKDPGGGKGGNIQ